MQGLAWPGIWSEVVPEATVVGPREGVWGAGILSVESEMSAQCSGHPWSAIPARLPVDFPIQAPENSM